MTKAEFLEKFCETNPEWVAQQLLMEYTPKQIAELRHQLKKLHKVAYKEWARDMSLNELLEVLNNIKDLK